MPNSVVCFGELLLRLAAPSQSVLFQEMALTPSFCGAEANVAVALAGFGHNTTMVGALPDNALGKAARSALAGLDVNTQMPAMKGRMGLFFLQPGAMSRPASIIYDRDGSAFAQSGPGSYDWDILLEGARYLFVGGITAALSQGTLAALRDAMAKARAKGVCIAFDTNFRPSLWQGRKTEAAAVLRDLSCQADILFAGRRATAMMAGGTYDDDDPEEGFAKAARTMFELSPTLKYMAATRREVLSSDRMRLTGLLADRNGISSSREIALENIVDRVGTGDAFAAGIIHGIIVRDSRAQVVEFGASAAEWGHSIPGDFLRASVSDIAGLASSCGDVKR